MARRKTHKQYVEQVISIKGNTYEFIGEYVNSKTKIRVKHLDCNYVWDIAPFSLLSKSSKPVCPNCNGGVSFNLDKFKKIVYNLTNDEYTVLDTVYKNAHTPMKFLHNDPQCLHVFYKKPNEFQAGKKCPYCGIRKHRDTTMFKEDIFKLYGYEYQVLGEFVSTQSKIKIKHSKCGNVYEPFANNILMGHRCPFCNFSNGEFKISNHLKNCGIKFEPQFRFNNCINKTYLPFDFAIFNKEDKLVFIIEYDGEGHFEPFRFSKDTSKMIEKLKQTQINDQIKDKYCKDNNIPLLRIPYWEFDNIEQILNDFILSLN